MQQHKRTNFVSKPNFQLKLFVMVMLLVILVANLVGGTCYFMLSHKVQIAISKHSVVAESLDWDTVRWALATNILFAELLALCVVFVLTMLATHTIAGPVYRIEKTLEEMAEGDLSQKVRLRPADEFKEVADALNEMAYQISGRIRKIRRAVQEVEAAQDRDFSPVYQAFDEIKLAGQRVDLLDELDVPADGVKDSESS